MRPPNRDSGRNKKDKATANFLGDESATSDDEDAFQSPERNDNTDYGLEFTTSRLINPRHSSTVRKPQTPPSARRENTDDGNSDSDEPVVASESRTLRSSPKKPMPLQPATSSSNARQTPAHRTAETNSASVSRRSAPNNSSSNRPAPTNQPARMQQNTRSRARKQSRPATLAKRMQREIERLRSYPDFLVPKLPFARVIRELMMDHSPSHSPFKISRGALEALQTACELYMTQRFQDAYLLTLHRGRVTLEVRDMALVAFICQSQHS